MNKQPIPISKNAISDFEAGKKVTMQITNHWRFEAGIRYQWCYGDRSGIMEVLEVNNVLGSTNSSQITFVKCEV